MGDGGWKYLRTLSLPHHRKWKIQEHSTIYFKTSRGRFIALEASEQDLRRESKKCLQIGSIVNMNIDPEFAFKTRGNSILTFFYF